MTNKQTVWEYKQLSSLGSFSKGAGISKADLVPKGVPCIRYAEIYTKYNFLLRKCLSHIPAELASQSAPIVYGNILFAGSGETAEDIGKSVAYLGEETAYASGDIIIFTLNDKKAANPLFLAYYLNTIGRKQLNRLGEGQSIVHIYPEELSKVSVPCPSTEEQQKTVEVLETWDKAIQLTRKLIEQKELQKKYLMQQLLTGRTRLKGFVTPWKTERLGHFKSIIIEKGTALSSQNIEKGPIPVIAGGQTVPYYHKYWTHDVPCITISASGAYAGFVWLHSGKIWASDCSVIYTRGYDLNFLYYCLKSQQNHLFYLQTGGAQAHIYPSEIRSLKIPNISLQEQQAIVQLLNINFQGIDILRQKLAKLEEQKKGLMQVLLTGKVRLQVEK